MLRDGCGAFHRVKVIVGIDIAMRLVLDEEGRVHSFAYIVEERAHPRKQGICANTLQSAPLLS